MLKNHFKFSNLTIKVSFLFKNWEAAAQNVRFHFSCYVSISKKKRTCLGNEISSAQVSEAATQKCSLEKVSWNYAANLQENTHVEVRFQ